MHCEVEVSISQQVGKGCNSSLRMHSHHQIPDRHLSWADGSTWRRHRSTLLSGPLGGYQAFQRRHQQGAGDAVVWSGALSGASMPQLNGIKKTCDVE